MIMSTIISISFTLLTGLLTYFVTYQLHMQDQFFLVMLVMLGTIGIFLIPWQLVSKKLNKGPSYALGLGIASIAIIGGILPAQPSHNLDLCGCLRCRVGILRPVCLPVEHDSGCG